MLDDSRKRVVLRAVAARGLLAAWLMLLVTGVLSVEVAADVYREELEPHWIDDATKFWYRNDNAGGTREFILVDVEEGTREPAFDHGRVAEQIGDGATATTLPVVELDFDGDGEAILLKGETQAWRLDRASGEISLVESDDPADGGVESQSFIRPSRNGGEESAITFDNRLDRAVELFWIDAAGNRQSYGVIEPGGQRSQHTYENHSWLVTDAENEPLAFFVAEAREVFAVIDADTQRPRTRGRRSDRGTRGVDEAYVTSPDGAWQAFVSDHNLWLRSSDGGDTLALSSDGVSTNSFHRDAIRSRAIGMNYDAPDFPAELPEVFWSPNSRYLIALQTTVVPEPVVTLVESSPGDQLQPKVQTYPYIKPGDPIPQATVRLFDVERGVELPVDQSLLQNPWSIGRFDWADDSSRVTFLYNQRGHQVLRVVAIEPVLDGRSAETLVLVDERSNTFIDYSQKQYLNFLTDRGELLWMSERDGWNHLYLFDAASGELERQVTQGEWLVRRVERVDEQNGQIWFWALGYHDGQDPYYEHLCRVSLGDVEGEGPLEVVPLTRADGTHSIQWSPDNRCFVATWSRVNQAPVHELRDGMSGRLLVELEKADDSELIAEGVRYPEPFVAKGRDGETDIYGVIHYPQPFDEDAIYPVIESIYAGPHGAFVPKGYRSRPRSPGNFTSEGYVVVQIDGMGTNWRSKAFHDVAWKNLKDSGYPDRILWMKAAAEARPWMDLSRVGVFGGSAGGQNAMRAVLDHADFYKAAAADCGCHDNRMDKIWWNEAWMGLPGDGSYVKSSNMEDAHKLGGALLLTVGELDRNVDPSSTYQVVHALQEAGKEFEYMMIPGGGHGSGGGAFGSALRLRFFNKHLKP